MQYDKHNTLLCIILFNRGFCQFFQECNILNNQLPKILFSPNKTRKWGLENTFYHWFILLMRKPDDVANYVKLVYMKYYFIFIYSVVGHFAQLVFTWDDMGVKMSLANYSVD